MRTKTSVLASSPSFVASATITQKKVALGSGYAGLGRDRQLERHGVADLDHEVDRYLAEDGDRQLLNGRCVGGGAEDDDALRLLLSQERLAGRVVDGDAGRQRIAVDGAQVLEQQ